MLLRQHWKQDLADLFQQEHILGFYTILALVDNGVLLPGPLLLALDSHANRSWEDNACSRGEVEDGISNDAVARVPFAEGDV